MALLELLIKDGWLKNPLIIEAFTKIKRKDFLNWKGDGAEDLSEINEALPIGHGQTISQPLTVAFMLELLDPKPGNKILDIGSGSGWTTALLSQIAGERGKVIAVEIIPELKEFGENNNRKYNFVQKGIAEFHLADGSKGFEKESPFDRILVSASSKRIFKAWKDQLKTGGKIVAPVKNSIRFLEKKPDHTFKEIEYQGFAFVPLV
ncbi:MAG: class I SAM-dependent methyltransferase [bacterium]|nr:class I SAM-dependent methyltransferase [bacterium]